ncbi:YtxH domain-containing protein [Paenibacillus ginsengarvi]|uniref:YtxH domain-containing protein n=1 Tax=Paenibacillus ginsengarvi TaxID=400777 RepID=A0A3B0BEZ0_9BACL|nr:YtxH domain-containing protein [Paenibacillus ginsengarvi]RKN71260.1 hypothetical protein D7M11_29645 [Paenibacillus ginsengarvi]
MKITSGWKGVLLGGAAGATAALLLSPVSGKKLRQSLRKHADSALERGANAVQSVRDKTAELAGDLRDKAGELQQEVKDKAVQLADDAAEMAHKAAGK